MQLRKREMPLNLFPSEALFLYVSAAPVYSAPTYTNFYSDGSSLTNNLDGSYVYRSNDGSVDYYTDGGYYVTDYPDGSYMEYHADGSWESYDASTGTYRSGTDSIW